MGSMVNHKKNQRTLAYHDSNKARKRILLQTDGPGAIGPGSQDIYRGSKYKINADEQAQEKCPCVHGQTHIEKLAGWRQRRFHSTNTSLIPVHITVKTITGRIY